MWDAHPNFGVLEVGPGPRTRLWSYVSLGTPEITPPSHSLCEFLLCTGDQTPRALELVTMAAWYHIHEGLDVGHTLPIGQPWDASSLCNHFLISRPYPFGPVLEQVAHAESVSVLWLLPITPQEFAYKVEYGLEALEQRFDASALRYWDMDRPSVI